MFDYKEAQKKVMENLDIFNINGKNQARRMLEYLEVCPFFEVVAEHMNDNVDNMYKKLKYYLGDKEWEDLRNDVRTRRVASIDEFKQSKKLELKALDDEKDVQRDRDRDT